MKVEQKFNDKTSLVLLINLKPVYAWILQSNGCGGGKKILEVGATSTAP